MELESGKNGGDPRSSDAKPRRKNPFYLRQRFLWIALAAAAVLAAVYFHRPGTLSDVFFPRQPSEFLGPAELDKRLAVADARIKANPEDLQALTDSGILLFQKGTDQYPDAINQLEEARKLGGVDPRMFYYLGVMYQEEGLYPFAVESYQRFLRNRPDDVEVRLLLAKLRFQSGEYADAAAQYRQLSQLRPKDDLIKENLALSLWKGGQQDDATALLNMLSGRGKETGRRAEFYLGQMEFEEKDYKEALRSFLTVLPIEDAPDLGLPPAEVHAAIAANFDKLTLYKEAKEHWEKALQYDPQNSQYKSSLRATNAALDKANRAAARAARIAAARAKKKKT